MPKHKTHKGLKHRVRITRTGKVIRRKAGRRHLMSGKSAKRARQLRQPSTIEGSFVRSVRKKLPGG